MSSQIVSGAKWTAIERFSNQFIQLIVSIIISRLISPEEFGILAVLLVFINISQVFIDSGLGNALIYYNRIDRKDFNTTFTFNSLMSISLFSVIFLSASPIQKFYNLPNLELYLKVSGLVLITNSLIVVPSAILKIKLDFKSLATANLISNILSSIIGINMATLGFGIWALIGQMLSKSIILSILLLIKCRWIPSCIFSVESLKKLYKYGVNIFASSIITKFTDEGIATLIAKFLTPFNLGLYSRSGQFASFPTSCIGSVVTTVTFPALSSAKNDKARYERLYLSALELQAFLVIPLYIWLAVEAKPIILVLLGNKWIDAIPIFQILCLGRILALPAITTEQNLNAKGRSDLCLKQQVLKLLLKIILVFIALPFGILAVALADALQTLLQFWITNKVAEKTIGYTFKQQTRLITPYLLSSIFAGSAGYVCILFFQNLILALILSSIIGISFYLLSVLLIFKKNEPYLLLKKFIK